MARELLSRVQAKARPLIEFWTKLNEDWVLNFSGMLAYNYLTAIAPLALLILAIAGLTLGAISSDTFDAFVQGLSSRLPAGGSQLVSGALTALAQSAGVLLIIAIVTALFAGSRLFVTLENCFCVIYRLRNRGFIAQNIMALSMTLLFAILAPLAFFASSQLFNLFTFFTPTNSPVTNFFAYLEGFIAGVLVAFFLFYTMYLFVPNRPRSWRQGWGKTWPGALSAAILMNLYEQLFPLYQNLFLQNAGYGSVVGLAIVAIIFLYYTGFITLLGAEIIVWFEGLRPLGSTLPDLYREREKAAEQAAERQERQEAAQGRRAATRDETLPPGTPA